MTTLGEILARAREEQGLTLAQIADLTKVKIQILTDIEANDFSRMPAQLYARGFIKLYAESVGLDPAPLINAYNRLMTVRANPLAAPAEMAVDRATVMRKIIGETGGTPLPAAEPPTPAAQTAVPEEAVAEPEPVAAAPLVPEPAPVRSAPPPEERPFRLEAEAVAAPPAEPETAREPELPRYRPHATPRRATAQSWGYGDWRANIKWLSPEYVAAFKLYAPIILAVLLVIIFLVSSLNRLARRHEQAAPAKTAVLVPAKKTVKPAPLRLAQEPPPPYIGKKP